MVRRPAWLNQVNHPFDNYLQILHRIAIHESLQNFLLTFANVYYVGPHW